MFTTSWKIEKLALSSESNRVAAALVDGTVWLWDSGSAELIDRFESFHLKFHGSKDGANQLVFSPTGIRLAYSSAESIKLRDGISGRFVADLPCGSSHIFEFSGDGSRIASLSRDEGFTLWNSESGGLIGAVRNVNLRYYAISADGSLADCDSRVSPAQIELWSENRDHLVKIKVLHTNTLSMAFSSDNILAIATDDAIKLYSVKTHSFIHTLPLRGTVSIAFSPDCTRLAIGIGNDGNMRLLDIRDINSSDPPPKGNATAVTALALSRDCSRLACGLKDGSVELWGTSPTMRRIGPLALRPKMEAIFFRIVGQSRHTRSVEALGFDPDGGLFASGSGDGTIKLWNGVDGALRGTLKVPGRLRAVALSNSVLVATARDGDVTLWSLDTLSPIHTFTSSNHEASKVSIAENSTLIAVLFGFRHRNHVALLDMVNRTTIATFDVTSFDFYDDDLNIHTMTFLPDNSQLMAHHRRT
ncbi:hypothetical protein M378DRAFT_284514 [Amanita muscaria Koide BX008]|uniref:Uncharacterized protein n=1 Tax=Amanita muscaria (strain Koide BX008) TaxID=946122 RepID=A0A0C2WCM2_AMAMK|nr:hypothetical protein M378DRAFT_284514 [Amanita muscaria Koide BX008]